MENVLLGDLVAKLTGHKYSPDELLFSQNEDLAASFCDQAQDMSVIVYSTQTWRKVASFTFEEDVSIMRRMSSHMIMSSSYLQFCCWGPKPHCGYIKKIWKVLQFPIQNTI